MLKHGLNTRDVQGQLFGLSPSKRLGVIASYPALALAIGFFAVTCFVLFKDVFDGASITTDHVMSFAVLVGTFASGHLLSEQLRQWRLLPSLGLLILFIAGTFYCVTASGGRNAATTGAKAELVHKSNDDRARIEADLKGAKGRLLEAQDKEADECASGPGTRCKGRKATREERQTYVNVLEAQLRMMDPARSEYPELRHAAKVFASVVSASEQLIFDRLVLWFPFVKALFCEIATIVFGSIAIRHPEGRTASLAESVPPKAKTLKRRNETVPRKHSPTIVPFRKAKQPFPQEEALRDLLNDKKTVPSQEVLAERWNRSKATVSRWLAEWEATGIVNRTGVGRRKTVAVRTGPKTEARDGGRAIY